MDEVENLRKKHAWHGFDAAWASHASVIAASAWAGGASGAPAPGTSRRHCVAFAEGSWPVVRELRRMKTNNAEFLLVKRVDPYNSKYTRSAEMLHVSTSFLREIF